MVCFMMHFCVSYAARPGTHALARVLSSEECFDHIERGYSRLVNPCAM